MSMKSALYLGVAAIAIAAAWTISVVTLDAQQASSGAVPIDRDDIGGVVTGPAGPEAGVWVIAETTDLPTRFARIVVTDDQGRYVVPDLPKARYTVWVRGYGLVDSPQDRRASPAVLLNLRAVPAPNAAAAAHYYPAIYWYSMLKIPEASEFGGNSNIPENVTQSDWLTVVKNRSCIGCHQLGQLSTRTIPASLGTFPSSEAAWIRRVQSGQAGNLMLNPLTQVLGGAPFKYYGEWTDRVAKGELPHARPPRPQGVERNIVVTTWEWSDPKKYLHDLIASDRRYPTVNAYGKLYGSPEYATDAMPILDPRTHIGQQLRDARARPLTPPKRSAPGTPRSRSPWRRRPTGARRSSGTARPTTTTACSTGRAASGSRRRCAAPTTRTSARRAPTTPRPSCSRWSGRTARSRSSIPKTTKYTFVDTCFQTHHLQFGYDANDTLWTSGGGPVIGWVNTRMFDATGDAAKSQGWTAFVLDTNGNGKRDDYVEPDQPVDPTKDKRIGGGFYAVMPSPVDGSIWGSVGVFGGTAAVVRLAPGPNPPATALAEIYHVPKPYFGIRGADIDKQGVVWASMGSGHIGSFDRRKCKGPLNGPKATGDHCPEGWAFYQYPGPGFQGIGENSAESSYYTWVDQHNTFGLGADVPMSTANLNDGLVALKDGKMVLLRVPTRWASTPRASTGASTTLRPAGRAGDSGRPAGTGRPGSWRAARARSPRRALPAAP